MPEVSSATFPACRFEATRVDDRLYVAADDLFTLIHVWANVADGAGWRSVARVLEQLRAELAIAVATGPT